MPFPAPILETASTRRREGVGADRKEAGATSTRGIGRSDGSGGSEAAERSIRAARIWREWILTLSIGLTALGIVIAVIVGLVTLLPR